MRGDGAPSWSHIALAAAPRPVSLTQVQTSQPPAMDGRIEAGPSMPAGSHQTGADRLLLG